MPSELPELAGLGHGCLGRGQIALVLPDLVRRRDQDVRRGKARHAQIQAGVLQVHELVGNDLLVPDAQLRQAVVRQDIGTRLICAQVLHRNTRRLLDAFGHSGLQDSVPGQDHAFRVYQQRTDESVLP